MEALFHIGPMAASSLVTALFSAIWEGAVLVACTYAFLRLLPGLSAAARAAVWMNVFLLLLLLHALPAMGSHAGAGISTHHAPFELNLGWSLAIAGLWACLSLLRAAQLAVSAVRAHGMAKRATPVDVDAQVRPLLRVRGLAYGGRSAELCTSDEVERPSVFGFFRPRILIPQALLDRLTASELQQVVLHEMEHLRRGDDWTNLLQKMALVFFPLNPVLLWVERRLCAERELACDDGVLRSSGGRKAYAICLTRLAEYSMLRRSFSLVLGAWERQSELVRRVHRILRKPGKTMSPRQTAVLTGSVIIGVLGCALGLSRSPQLVTFAEPETSLRAQLAQAPVVRPMNAIETGSSVHAELAKAVMPQPTESHKFSLAQAEPAGKPSPRMANVQTHIRKKPATQQAWVLMTAWNDTGSGASMVLTVAQVNPQNRQDATGRQMSHANPQASNRTAAKGFAGNRMAVDPNQANRPTYAAVPFGNGWLLIQI